MREQHPKVTTKWMAGRIVQNWSAQEDAVLLKETLRCEEEYGKKAWAIICQALPGRTNQQCAQRWRHAVNPDVKRRVPWTEDEDEKLRTLIGRARAKGQLVSWADIARKLPGRSDQQVKGHWERKLDPDLALKVPWTRQEDEQLLRLQAVHDNHWAEMAKHLRGRNAQMCRTRFDKLRGTEAKLKRLFGSPTRAEVLYSCRKPYARLPQSPEYRARVCESAEVQCRSEVEAEVSDGSDEEYRPGQEDRKNLAKYSKRTKPRKRRVGPGTSCTAHGGHVVSRTPSPQAEECDRMQATIAKDIQSEAQQERCKLGAKSIAEGTPTPLQPLQRSGPAADATCYIMMQPKQAPGDPIQPDGISQDQAAEAAKETAQAGVVLQQEGGHPPDSPRGSLVIKMEPLQDCRSPGIVVRTRLSLSCPTPGHLLSASSPIAAGDQGSLWALVEESRRTASSEERRSGEAHSEDVDLSDKDDSVDISDTSDDSHSDFGGRSGRRGSSRSQQSFPESVACLLNPTRHGAAQLLTPGCEGARSPLAQRVFHTAERTAPLTSGRKRSQSEAWAPAVPASAPAQRLPGAGRPGPERRPMCARRLNVDEGGAGEAVLPLLPAQLCVANRRDVENCNPSAAGYYCSPAKKARTKPANSAAALLARPAQSPMEATAQEHGFLPGACGLHADRLASGMGAPCQKAIADIVRPAEIAPAFPGTDNLSPCKEMSPGDDIFRLLRSYSAVSAHHSNIRTPGDALQCESSPFAAVWDEPGMQGPWPA